MRIAGLGVMLVALAVASLLAGSVWLTPQELMTGLLDPHPGLARLILIEIRLPRLILAILVGGILGLGGAVLQVLLRNPLAEPGLLGVSPGAALGAILALYYGAAHVSPLATPLFALLGAGAATLAALLLARGGGTLALILAGTAISSIAAAGIALALNLAPDPYAAYEMLTWLMGSLEDRSWDHVVLAAPFVLAGAILLIATGPALDTLSLGEAQAESLGTDLRRTRTLAALGTALGVGAATAVTGVVGFVGLVAPHLVRPFVGHRPRAILLPASLVGAIVVLAADVATRTLPAGTEIRLGTFVSIIGAPLFLWLVLRVARRAP
ncbi:FecCD family ABC transporter permease [Sphingomonas sp.]|uniref:FecCD family ABC transporter permease n=1 Tax=Sphingomonas sp. TaxID=28214 RepID=UPI003B3A0FAA